MTVLVTGWVRLAPEDVAKALPAARAMMAASRAEDGCFEYAYSEDLLEPGLVRVTERWRDFPALEAHFRKPHMAEWRQALSQVQLLERNVVAYEVASERKL
jgi:quinol monooxygenase YgiN